MGSLYICFMFTIRCCSSKHPKDNEVFPCATVPFIVVYVSQGGSLQVSPDTRMHQGMHKGMHQRMHHGMHQGMHQGMHHKWYVVEKSPKTSSYIS